MLLEKQIEKYYYKLTRMGKRYDTLIFQKVGEISVQYLETKELYTEVPGDQYCWENAGKGTVWGEPWGYAWFKGTVRIPAELDGQKLFVRANTDGIESLFWIKGVPSGIFNHSSEASARGNHRTLMLTQRAVAGETIDVAFESYAGHPVVGTQPFQTPATYTGYPNRYNRKFDSIDLMVCREDIKDFVFDLRSLTQLAKVLPEESFRRAKVLNCLLDLFKVLMQSPEDHPEELWRPKLAEARKIMKPLLEARNSVSAPKAGIVGHSHMDTAWVWTIEETIRKCARTYSNVLNLMEQYPEYRFVQSSALHLEMMRVHYPAIFEGIKRRVQEGRWEPNGGVWVECDGNIVSGESLVRQFLKGQQYTRKHFGYTSDSFWLPDTFGYSAAIPQIAKGCSIHHFLTTKLTWNDTNSFPYDTFYWKGTDGTVLFTHFNDIHCWPDVETLYKKIHGDNLNDAKSIKNYIQHKQVNDRRLISYGFGDGGGGPMYDMLEMARRCEDLEGVPKAEYTSVSKFMEELEQTSRDIPVYTGELYLEGHRGTLTQMHQIKRNNRKAEIALRNLEIMNVMGWLHGAADRLEQTEQLYEVLLLNQFHDILPGTSIPEVHDRAIREVGDLIEEANVWRGRLTSSLMENGSAVTVWNTLSWTRLSQIVLEHVEEGLMPEDPTLSSQWIEDVMGRKKLVVGGARIPAFGAQAIGLKKGEPSVASPFQYEGDTLDTPFARIRFDAHGYFESFLDKPTGRELRGNGHPLNALLMGEDIPLAWENWDIDPDLKFKLELQTGLLSREVVADGALQFRIRNTYRIGGKSTLTQDLVAYADDPRIDFETVIDWKDPQQFLKVGFDVNIRSNYARHEIQYGHMERPSFANNSYDLAMFEVCCHKWTDLSENRFGVAILNDCKYGISVEQSDIRLSLHKGGCRPDPRGDQGVHEMTYSFLPHNGGFTAEQVIRPAYELNIPAFSAAGIPNRNIAGLLEVDAPNIIVEAVKFAESESAYVVRLYEAERSAVSATVSFGRAPKKVVATNMLEEALEAVPLAENRVRLTFRAFEIKTIKVYI